MSFDNFIRVDQRGTVIKVNMTKIVGGAEVPYDVSATSSVKIEIQKPNGERMDLVTANFVTDGINGAIVWKDTSGIFDIAGRWKVRGIANFTSGDLFPGSWVGFSVDE